MWVVIAVVLLLCFLLMAGTAGPAERDITEAITLTDKEEEWLLGARDQWSQTLESAWEKAVRKGERYQTKGGAHRLRLGGLGPDQEHWAALGRIVYLAGEAERERLEAEYIDKHGPDSDPWADPRVSRAEERLERRKDKLEGKLWDAKSKYDAKDHWWNQISDDERRELRRMGQSWRDFMN